MKKENENSTSKRTEILVAEDSPTQAAQIKHFLESNNYMVYVATDGKKAIEWLSKNKPSLVISDIVMPGMNGFELCKQIKLNKTTGQIPVILLTQLSDPGEIIEGLSCGADSFITKPYNEDHLLSTILRFISDESHTDQKKVPFGVEIPYKGAIRHIQAEQQNVIRLLLSIYEGAIQQNNKLIQTQDELRSLNERLESLVEERTSDLREEILLSNQIADKLKESEERFRNLYNEAVVGLYRTNSQGEILLANRALLEMLGFQSFEELAERNLTKTGYGSSYQRHVFINQIEKEGEVKNLEAIWIRRDGKEIFVRESAKTIRDSEGKFLYYDGTVEDITERKHAEELLKHIYEFNASLLQTIPFAMHIVDEIGTVLYQNDIFKMMSEEEGIGKKCWDLYKDDKKQCSNCPLIKGIAIGNTDTIESHDILGNRIFEISNTGMMFENKKALLEIFQDITEAKLAEEKLIKAKDKAEESDRLKTAFLHNISHEIRTPMNAIAGFSALLAEPEVDKHSQKDYIEVITNSSNHLLAIISDIVDISNIEANLVKISKNKTNVNSILQSLCDQFIPKANEKKIKLVCETAISDSDALVLTDSTKLNQILINLINNAIKFTDKGYVKVGCVLTDKFLEFSVSDTGIGIPAEYHAKIFDRFYQVQHSLARLYEGTGLGLAISKAHAELMGGKVWLTSEPGKGTSFYFTLPFEKQVVETMVIDERRVANGFVLSEKKTILVAEDIDSNFQLLRYFLTGINSDIIRAVNGKEAVEIFNSNNKIDLIFMDIKMPVMDGYTAVKLIREKNSAIPIIAQTAFIDDRERAIAAGCSGFISKPFDKKGLLNVLQEFI